MELRELYNMADKYDRFSCKPKLLIYKNGYIFDEDKSVKWNREEVERRNNEYNEELKRLNTEKNAMLLKWIDAVKLYIIEETKVKKTQADKIYNYLYTEYHNYGLTEILRHLDDLLELFI